jgi:hypothetical protein
VEQLEEFPPAGQADNPNLSPFVKATAAADLEAWRRRSFPVVLARRAEDPIEGLLVVAVSKEPASTEKDPSGVAEQPAD